MTPEQQIGPRLRALRTDRGVTLDVLAARSGLTKGYLSKIETGKKLPPIATLSRISGALDADIAHFFQKEDSGGDVDDRVSLVRAGQRRPAVRGGTSFGYDYASLTRGFAGKAMEPFVFTFPARLEADCFFEHPGEEMLFILSGSVEFMLGGRTLMLAAGDCLYFDSSLPHRGRSIGAEAKALVVIHRPERETA